VKAIIKTLVLLVLLLAGNGARAFILDEEIFGGNTYDVLAPRDGHGVLHQGRRVIATDFDPRHRWRWVYYFEVWEQLIQKPAYVGALQRDLRRLGYYCGPIDGVYSPEVSDAIARLQKNHSLQVTGTLTDPVRRALHLP
jgi:Putative peptidoglycan binding domain